MQNQPTNVPRLLHAKDEAVEDEAAENENEAVENEANREDEANREEKQRCKISQATYLDC